MIERNITKEVMLMPRPRKWRKVEFIPHIREFIPCGSTEELMF
ncbi:MAG: hypothetical protein HPY66_0971 [Firmicutes bacterium]|nr:hypothetical protein [Bacillota bacterium]